MQSNENEMRLSYEAAVYKEQLRLLQGEMERISLTLMDMESAVRTLENLKTEDSIVQVGGGAFIKANIYSSHVILPIGAGYLVEMERETGAFEMKKRVESTRKAVDRLKEEFTKVSVKLQDTAVKIRDARTTSEIMGRVEENERHDYA